MTWIPKEEFIKTAIAALRTGRSMGIQIKYSGLHDAWLEYYGSDDLEAVIQRMEASGILETRTTAHGNLVIFLKGEMPDPRYGGSYANTLSLAQILVKIKNQEAKRREKEG